MSYLPPEFTEDSVDRSSVQNLNQMLQHLPERSASVSAVAWPHTHELAAILRGGGIWGRSGWEEVHPLRISTTATH